MCSIISGGTRPVSTLNQPTIWFWNRGFFNGGIGKVTMTRGSFKGGIGKVTVTRGFFDGGIEESITIAVLSFQWGFFENE